jgi:hypothetical protein
MPDQTKAVATTPFPNRGRSAALLRDRCLVLRAGNRAAKLRSYKVTISLFAEILN